MILSYFRQSLRETFPARASEWAFAAMLINWSIILTANERVFIDGPSYAAMAQVAEQGTWASLCFLAGGGRLVLLAINGAWRRSPHLRALGAFVSCFVWFQISLGLLQAGTFATGLAVYPVIFVFDAYNVIRAMGEAGKTDAAHGRPADGTHT